MTTFDTKTFITTTLPYVNSNPHIGHAFEFILGDAIARHSRKKSDIHFNIGLDEHGLKVFTKSKELGISPETHIKNLTEVWLNFCEKFEISYDTFYKTSSPDHHLKVQTIWKRFLERGDIYKKSYSGKYCVGCESFKLDKELKDGKCTDHPTTEVKLVEEENYFFRLGKYRTSLLNWIESTPEFLQPGNKLEELKNLILNSDDISISRLRENCPWGVGVPDDDTQVIYVWFDALFSYVLSAGYLTDNFEWNRVIQLCGPDNLRFQAVILQALLESEGIKKSDRLLVHGTILDKEGRKMSKSLGNVVDPLDQLDKYGLDAVKYYALAGLSTYSDSGWNEEDLKNIFNSDICNDWGNLISRTLHLIDTFSIQPVDPTEGFKSEVDSRATEIEDLWNSFRIREALQRTNLLVKTGNSYINETQPWGKTRTDAEKSEALNNLHYLLTIANGLYSPVFPAVNSLVDVALEERKKIIPFNKIK